MSEVSEIVETFKQEWIHKKNHEILINKIKSLDDPSFTQLAKATEIGLFSAKWHQELKFHLVCLRPDAIEERTAQRLLSQALNYRMLLEWHKSDAHCQRYWETCFALESPTSRSVEHNLVGEQPGIGRCGWCQRPLAVLLDLDLTDDRMQFVGLTGRRFRIPACIACTSYKTIFFQCDLEGTAEWRKENGPPIELLSDEFESWPQPLLTIGPRRSAYESLVRQYNRSQIGGCPAWEQLTAVPPCCQCGTSMIFLGQVAIEDFQYLGEGTVYAFLCRKCVIAATTYQCT